MQQRDTVKFLEVGYHLLNPRKDVASIHASEETSGGSKYTCATSFSCPFLLALRFWLARPEVSRRSRTLSMYISVKETLPEGRTMEDVLECARDTIGANKAPALG